jgi:hypothetical protein
VAASAGRAEAASCGNAALLLSSDTDDAPAGPPYRAGEDAPTAPGDVTPGYSPWASPVQSPRGWGSGEPRLRAALVRPQSAPGRRFPSTANAGGCWKGSWPVAPKDLARAAPRTSGAGRRPRSRRSRGGGFLQGSAPGKGAPAKPGGSSWTHGRREQLRPGTRSRAGDSRLAAGVLAPTQKRRRHSRSAARSDVPGSHADLPVSSTGRRRALERGRGQSTASGPSPASPARGCALHFMRAGVR